MRTAARSSQGQSVCVLAAENTPVGFCGITAQCEEFLDWINGDGLQGQTCRDEGGVGFVTGTCSVLNPQIHIVFLCEEQMKACRGHEGNRV